MLMCTRCKKRPAVVFVSNGVDGQPTQGLCLVCARELGIKPVNDIMEKMGITDEELEAATAQMTELMNLNNDNDEEEDLFTPGGTRPPSSLWAPPARARPSWCGCSPRSCSTPQKP